MSEDGDSKPISPACLVAMALGVLALVAAGIWTTGELSVCVVAGTRVATPEGHRRVETLRVGDSVWCRAPDGTQARGRVTATRSARVGASLRLTFSSGACLGVTAEHPISTPGGWVLAGDLSVGSIVHTRTGPATLKLIEPRMGSTIVYDLSVSPHPNFFAEGVLVHNKRIHGTESLAIRSLAQIAVAQSALVARGQGYEGSLSALGQSGLVDEELARGTSKGYRLQLKSGPGRTWIATARPVHPGSTGDRYFASNHLGVIFYTHSGPFSLTPDCSIPPGAQPVGK